MNSDFITLSKMLIYKQEQYNNIQEKVRNDKSEQKYGGNITKGIKGCLFGVGTIVCEYKNIPHNWFFSFSTVIPPQY